jgi:hypothetical protein
VTIGATTHVPASTANRVTGMAPTEIAEIAGIEAATISITGSIQTATDARGRALR